MPLRLTALALLLAACGPAPRDAPPDVPPPAPPAQDGGYSVVVGEGFAATPDAPAAEGFWTLPTPQAALADRRLRAFVEGAPAPFPDSVARPLAGFHRQYLGVVRGGRRLVFVNAFPASLLDDADGPLAARRRAGLTTALVSVEDGGCGFWRVLYDVAVDRFSEFACNGEA